jgi:hypothetical protein
MNWCSTHMAGICMRPRHICARPDMGLRRRFWVTSGTCTVVSSGRPPLPSATESTEHRHSDRLSHPLASETGKKAATRFSAYWRWRTRHFRELQPLQPNDNTAHKQSTDAAALRQEYNIFVKVNVSVLSHWVRSGTSMATECNSEVAWTDQLCGSDRWPLGSLQCVQLLCFPNKFPWVNLVLCCTVLGWKDFTTLILFSKNVSIAKFFVRYCN